MTQVILTQKINGNVSIEQIKTYLVLKKWELDDGKYRSRDGQYVIRVSDGEQAALNTLSFAEGRCSSAVYLDIIALDRNA